MNDNMEDYIALITDRSNKLAEDYTEKLNELVDKMVPTTLSNDEYAARCAALMIALSRELARCSVTFGETFNIEPEVMVGAAGRMFGPHYAHCLSVIRGNGQTVQ